MPKVLVLFSGRTDNTAALAKAIGEGAESVKFTEVEIRRIEDLESVESIAQYDALVVGSPARYEEEMKQILDRAGEVAKRGALADKVGSAFVSGSAQGEDETNIMSMLIPMMRLGIIIVPPGPGDAAAVAAGDLAAARRQGARVAKVAEWVRHAKSHEAHSHKH